MQPADTNMVEFINEWERQCTKIKKKKTELLGGVLAYHLLESANLSYIQQTMLRTFLTELNEDQVKRQLKNVHDKSISNQ